jgi:hypothetical protein
MKFKLGKIFRIIGLRWRTRHLTPTLKTRTMLRHQYCNYKGEYILVMKYIQIVASMMPRMSLQGQPVDHTRKLREIYFKFDLPGLKYYIESINRNIKRTGRGKYLERKRNRQLAGGSKQSSVGSRQ